MITYRERTEIQGTENEQSRGHDEVFDLYCFFLFVYSSITVHLDTVPEEGIEPSEVWLTIRGIEPLRQHRLNALDLPMTISSNLSTTIVTTLLLSQWHFASVVWPAWLWNYWSRCDSILVPLGDNDCDTANLTVTIWRCAETNMNLKLLISEWHYRAFAMRSLLRHCWSQSDSIILPLDDLGNHIADHAVTEPCPHSTVLVLDLLISQW